MELCGSTSSTSQAGASKVSMLQNRSIFFIFKKLDITIGLLKSFNSSDDFESSDELKDSGSLVVKKLD